MPSSVHFSIGSITSTLDLEYPKRASSLSVEDDEHDENSGLVSRHIKFVFVGQSWGYVYQNVASCALSLSSLPPFYGSLIKRLACNRPPCRLAHTAAHNCRFPRPGTPPQHTRRVSVPSWVPVLWSSLPFPTLCRKRLISLYNFCSSVAAVVLAMFFPPPTFESRCRAVVWGAWQC